MQVKRLVEREGRRMKVSIRLKMTMQDVRIAFLGILSFSTIFSIFFNRSLGFEISLGTQNLIV